MSPADLPSAPRASLADVFLGRMAAGRFDELAELFEADVCLHALLPDGLHEWRGVGNVVEVFVGWFRRVDEYQLLEAGIGHVGPRLQLQWRARVRRADFGDGDFVVEQHVYADPGPSGRIQAMSMLCSGFARARRED
jgi:hypothetical protein